MDFVVDKGEVVMMSDRSNYLVVSTVEYEGAGYLHLAKVIGHPLDVDTGFDFDNMVYAKEIVQEVDGEEKYFLEFVTDEALNSKLGSL